jgi:membrane-associated phospholipid phosphatase
MSDILLILLWPVGIAVILGAGVLLARRTPMDADRGARSVPSSARPRSGRRRGSSSETLIRDLVRFWAVIFAGLVAVYAVTVLIGELAKHAGPTIDKPIWLWTYDHQVSQWITIMLKATEVGDKWTTWGAAITAAVCLTFIWRQKRWLPAVALGTLIVCDHYLTRALVHTIERTPPPGSSGGFPSGGTDRAVVFYGLIAYLIWREVSGRRRTAILAGSVVVALGFEEGVSRGYLAVHWFTDILGGFIYGGLLLVVFVIAVQMIAGRPTIAAAGAGQHAGTDAPDGNAARAGLAGAGAAGTGVETTVNSGEVPT